MNKIKLDSSSAPKEVTKRRTLNFVAKIVCVFVAFLIWFYVYGTDTSTQKAEFTLAVDIENENVLTEKTGWSVVSGKENNIDVTFSGKKNVISKLTENDVRAYVDVSKVETAGRHSLDIVIEKPSDIDIDRQSATSIFAYIDRNASINVPVTVKCVDYILSSDQQLDEPTTNISEVRITGPESEIASVSAAQATLKLGNVSRTVNATSTLELVDENGEVIKSNYIRMMTTSVSVTVKLFTIKEVPLRVAYKNGYFNDDNVKITLSPESVTLKGEPHDLTSIDSILLTTLDEKNYPTDKTINNVTIPIPDGLTNINTVNTASVDIKHINTTTKTVLVDDISLINTSGLSCELQTESVSVTLRGPYSALSNVTGDDIQAVADMKAYSQSSGLTEVPLTIKIGGDYSSEVYEVYESDPYKAFVKVG